MTKTCTECGKDKELGEFHKEVAGKFGRKSKCSECLTDLSRKWKAINKDRECDNRKRWNSNNKDRHRAATYKWREKHPKEHLSYVAGYQKKRKSSDPQFKLLTNMRSLLYNHLTRQDLKKHQKLEQYLCCSFEDFRKHVEDKFTPEMTWGNYGSYWSVDHTCPCNQAQNQDEFIKLWHYSNLRPMKTHGEDGNFAKSDKKTAEAEDLCLKLLQRSWLD